MDNNTQQPQMATVSQPSYQTPEQPTPLAASQQKPKGKGKIVLVTLLLVLLISGVGFLGYTYKTTNDMLKKKSQELSAAYTTIGKFQKIIDASQAEKDFIATQNTAVLSRNLCSSNSILMSDVHINDKFAVFRYLCANSSNAIRIAALKKLPDNNYEFTYGDSNSMTNRLPSYIYDTEPEFFSKYGVIRY